MCGSLWRPLNRVAVLVTQAAFINADALARFRGFGGVRIEDVVRITATGIENLTWCPRTVEDVEGVCAGHIKSRFELTRKTGPA